MTAETPTPTAANTSSDLPREVEVAIVGAGFGGLGMAIRLKQAGIHDLVLLERAADIGGTWWANTYPGCQCDVPSNLYSFSFARNAEWTHSYPMQGQILEYLRDCARRFGILPHVRLNCEMLDAEWVPDAGRWRVETTQGTLSARMLVSAPGLLSEPSTPDLPGLDSFEGTKFHTATWDHDHDLSGERVMVLGTGATAVQVVPNIQPRVGRLYVFQRTPPWVFPHLDRPVGKRLRRLYRALPPLQRLSRGAIYALRELFVLGLALDRRLMKLPALMGRRHLRKQVADPQLRRELTPDYDVGCKRITLSDDWYPALTAPNAEVVTSPIRELRAHSVVTEDGTERELDTIVLATGFSPTDPPIARRLRGREGKTLSDVWQGSPQAYLGTAVAGFPNLFLIYGPNTNLGHTSVVYMMERQIEYAVDAIRSLRSRRVGTVEVRPEVQDAWNEEMQSRLADTVWDKGGCSSWYLDANGRNSLQWPGFTFDFARRVRRFHPEDYRLGSEAREPVSAG